MTSSKQLLKSGKCFRMFFHILNVVISEFLYLRFLGTPQVGDLTVEQSCGITAVSIQLKSVLNFHDSFHDM